MCGQQATYPALLTQDKSQNVPIFCQPMETHL